MNQHWVKWLKIFYRDNEELSPDPNDDLIIEHFTYMEAELEFMKDKEVIIDENRIKANSWTPPMIKLKEKDRGGINSHLYFLYHLDY